uniref:Uncharacterized protein n=1 Tax=Panagrolaimus sp. PS1159 TaxID=55785 RepID=A0AC35GN65_9BILA
MDECRGPTETAGITDGLKPIGKLAYSFENTQLSTAGQKSPSNVQIETTANAADGGRYKKKQMKIKKIIRQSI